jgi:hypothetical protein
MSNTKSKADPCGIFNPRQQIAGWSDAAAEESELRNDAMLGLDETICGFTVKPLCFRHILWLNVHANIFLAAFTPEELMTFPEIHLHVARFMWIFSPQFSPFDAKARESFFDGYNEKAKAINALEVIKAILKFMDDSTFDLRMDGPTSLKSHYSSCAGVVHALCSIYSGVSPFPNAPNSALDMPLQIAGQLLRVHIKGQNPKATLNNRADVLEQKWLEDLNRQLFKGNG